MKSRRFHSSSTSPGIAVGNAFRLRRKGQPVPRYWIREEQVDAEVKRFRAAVRVSRDQLSKIQAKMCRIQGHEQIKILESHRLFLQDDMLVGATIEHIYKSSINAEWALDKTLAHLRLSFLNVQEGYFRDRQQDIDYAGQRVMENLLGSAGSLASDIPGGDVVVVAHDISPAEVVTLPRDRNIALVLESGGETSHTAIVARSLEIPALFGVPDIVEQIEDGEVIIVDGMKGLVIASPHKTELEQYRTIQKKYKAIEELLLRDIHLPAVTEDGFHIQLEANIELLEEIPSALHHGAEGIGLYRTEFLFLNRLDEPSEEEQVENYTQVLQQMKKRMVTIRTIDVGGDKLDFGKEYEEQANPALGVRAIRFCLRETSLFKTQLRALLRASVVGNLRILIPMISHIEEVRQVKKMLEEVKRELTREKIEFHRNIPLGIMIEVPSAALMADKLAEEVDFFSIGTNDLLQYSLAMDRSNEMLSDLFTPYHPALFRMLKDVARAAKRAGISVALCGELAADPLAIVSLIGMKFDSLSMNPISIPRVKKILRSVRQEEAAKLLEKVLRRGSAYEIEKLLRREAKRKAPAVVQQFGELSVK